MDDIKQRLGKIRIANYLIWDVASMSAIFKDLAVLKVEYFDYSKYVIYTCACYDFDRLADGEMVPEYVAQLYKEVNGPPVRKGWTKI